MKPACRLGAVLALGLAALSGKPSLAEEEITLEYNYEGPDKSFVRTLFHEHLDLESYQESYPDRGEPGEHIYVGYFDLNDDGIEEMIVAFRLTWFCGSGVSGCTTYVFGRRGGAWRLLGDSIMAFPIATDERIGGYRTITSTELGLRWREDMNRYWDFCIDFQTGVEGVGKCLEEDGQLRVDRGSTASRRP